LDLRVSVFGSAGGQAVLSTWSDAAVLALVEDIGDHRIWGLERAGLKTNELLVMLKHARGNGYAVRSARYLGETALATTLNVIACPILQSKTAVGALALLWPKGYLSTARFAELHLQELEHTVSRISTQL
jgi:DNA-binding IclR family transcriptional regulator